MADYPSYRLHKPTISSFSGECVGPAMRAMNSGTTANSAAAWPGANRAIFVPLTIWAPYLVSLVWWANGATPVGNVDCGLYSQDGTLLFNAGSTAQAGASKVQSVSLGTPYRLTPGAYYIALACSSASANIFRTAPTVVQMQSLGCAQQASAVPLPATFTQATISSAYLPIFGIGSTTVI